MSRRISNIIKAANLGPAAGLAAPGRKTLSTQSAGHRGSDSSTITLHRNDKDVIEAIEIVCSCGQTTFVECVYPQQEPTS